MDGSGRSIPYRESVLLSLLTVKIDRILGASEASPERDLGASLSDNRVDFFSSLVSFQSLPRRIRYEKFMRGAD